MIKISDDATTVHIFGLKGLIDIDDFDKTLVKELFISGCSIQEFAFLGEMPNLEKLVVLDCRSEAWHTILGNRNVRILRLHTLKANKAYLEDVDFISKFPNVEYLYMNNFDIMNFPDVSCLPLLHTVMCSGRKLIDYLALEHVMSLKTFIGWCATDNHRTPAELFVPILKNPSLREFQYTQMFNVENKKLDEYVQTMRPDITYPIDERENGIANTSKTRDIAKLFF